MTKYATFKTNFGKVDMGQVIKIGLFNSSQVIRAQAQSNAPYDTGKLKQSIGIHPSSITKNTRQVAIGPRKVVYAYRREFENFKNPDKRLYMTRAFETVPQVIDREFKNALNIILDST